MCIQLNAYIIQVEVMRLEQEGESTMSSDSEPAEAGKIQSTSEAKQGKGSGAGQANTPEQFVGQRIGDAGSITPTSPESTTENKKTTEAAFSSGTKPGNMGQTQTPAETESTDFGQTDTTYSEDTADKPDTQQ